MSVSSHASTATLPTEHQLELWSQQLYKQLSVPDEILANKTHSYQYTISIILYLIIVLKWQNRLRSWNRQAYKLKVKMQPVSDDDVRRRFLEKPHFKLVAKGAFSLGRCYIVRQGIPDLRASNWESTVTDG